MTGPVFNANVARRGTELRARLCPLIAVGKRGEPSLSALGAGIDLRTDLPRYRVWRDGELVAEPNEGDGVAASTSGILGLRCDAPGSASTRTARVLHHPRTGFDVDHRSFEPPTCQQLIGINRRRSS